MFLEAPAVIKKVHSPLREAGWVFLKSKKYPGFTLDRL
jgi:hypothetical protein